MIKYLKLKKIVLVVLITLSINIFSGCTSIVRGNSTSLVNSLIATESNKNDNNMRVLNYDEVKDSLIRFHVIANSDNDDDQQLKLKVKNRVIDYLYPYLNSSQSLDESRKIIKDKMEDVKTLAQQVIKDNNYDYDVKVELSRENFPDKSYGNITLPQGNYEAFRIIIGSGQGRNWWCVMFPPLCFVDESKAQVEYDKTENKIKSNGKSFELESKDDSTENVGDKQADGNNIKIKFKIVEIFRDIFK
ncbi:MULTISPECIES: stage II sporulation protein R [Clostridium]|jgi:stage II sporulation protein R|uniref:Stage II sporulation protein R n=4 Tax=Clostridium TaxID=1485 RepID=A0A0B5QGL1_CLOBE|nr:MULTISPECIES: stage II sporulation protein R [Clostridium]ABR32583.1 Sporulation stage II, protein R [Clostridium beijerinckii NCIMB 8052]AIU04685.1 sporulation stage II, protein R [Clostridium beijerinckii ATCC 35702]AJG97097.1 stage II sporulation protein R [Clostridium beijerinckii]MBC2458043.1 stage II sporulation protein R [Clostridium beijerinckii]MBC2476338.1 stage II sporulation protein R [Clostridium beijerinckii]